MGNALTDKEFKQRLNYWAKRIGVSPVMIQVRPMKNKWASCSATGRMTFSRDLLRERIDFTDYVIVHELLHLLIPNHGKLFKSLLQVYLTEIGIDRDRNIVCGIQSK